LLLILIKRRVSQKYGAYRDKEGTCERAIFVIDRKGAISWSYLSPIAENPGADGFLKLLKNFQNKRVNQC